MKSKRPILPLLALTAMLILAPLGSWVYLKLGMDYRMTSVEQLLPKEFPSSIHTELISILKSNNKAKLIHINQLNDPRAHDLLEKLDERVVDKTYFELISLSSVREISDQSSIKYYSEIGSIEFENSFLLFDTSNTLRNYYQLNDDIGKEVIRHLAVILPLPKQSKDFDPKPQK